MKKDTIVKCVRCRTPMTFLKDNSRCIYRCSNFHVIGAHPNGSVMSYSANFITRALRVTAHHAAEKVFGKWDKSCPNNKKNLYRWLKSNSKSGHIGRMYDDELHSVIAKLMVLAREKVDSRLKT